MKLTRSQLLKLSVGAGVGSVVQPLLHRVNSAIAVETDDPPPSWNQTAVKAAIIAFMLRVTLEGSPDFIPVADRIAVLDNDGTLWAEQPLIQVLSIQSKLESLAASDPSLREIQPFKAALTGDMTYLVEAGEAAILELIAATVANQTQDAFVAAVRSFFDTALYPPFNMPVTQVVYQPMLELLDYLRANGFQPWICSGGGMDFMRVISAQLYGIPPQQVIGSSLKMEYREQNGQGVLWRLPEIDRINDKAEKPVGIGLQIGKRPVFAVGNVRSGGDIAMLSYCQSRSGASLQVLINHDDGDREFAYQEADNASLNAAQAQGWQVVSIKNDWKTVFPFQKSSTLNSISFAPHHSRNEANNE